ncbi:MAG TPA: DUF4062 domain-containing protein [Chitinophagales bacterium]|nr:DUF4062 domain-containing protein [Chitinophagales bacterium]
MHLEFLSSLRMSHPIKTPDQRLRVFVSSTLRELAVERESVKKAVLGLRLIPVMFELGARPYPPRDLYTAYLQQSHIFIGIYWQQYGWIAPGMSVSGIEDEFLLSENMPRLIYIKEPSPERADGLKRMLDSIMNTDVSFKTFSNPDELYSLVQDDLAVLLTERYELSVTKLHSQDTDELNQQIPIPPTLLIGREGEVKEITELLSGEAHLITLTGVGGIGKTRVALEVARQMKSSGSRQVCFVPLDSIEKAEDVPAAILRKAFPDAQSSLPPAELLVQLFRGKSVLLVLDNFEHVITSYPVVVELLRQCPDLKILVTSREAMRTSWEIEYALRPLELYQVVNTGALPSFEELSPAVKLFLLRAQAVRPDFKLTPENYDTIVSICQTLDGLPLAIELAAARMRLFTPAQLLPRLEHRFDLLKNRAHDVPMRHQTLKATIDWSFNLLTPTEQRLLCLLSVFNGGCSLEAVSAVASDHPAFDKLWDFPRQSLYINDAINVNLTAGTGEAPYLELVESLFAKSLTFTSVNKFGMLRINFYQTIIQYCRERLPELGLEVEANYKHLIYFVYMAESNWGRLKHDNAAEAYELYDNELDNMTSALDWSVTHKPLLGLRLAVALEEYWDTRAMTVDAVKWLSTLLDAAAKKGEENRRVMFVARTELCRALFRIARYDEAWELAKQCAAEARENNEPYLLADALGMLCIVNSYALRNENKEALLDEAIALTRKHNYKMRLLDLIQDAAADKIFSGSTAEGLKLAEESLALSKEMKAKRWEAIAYALLGFGYTLGGNPEKGEAGFHGCLRSSADVNDQMLPVYGLLGCVQVALLNQQLPRALTLLGAVQAVVERPGITIVPVAMNILNTLMEAVNAIPEAQRTAMLNQGRKLHFDEAVQLALHAELSAVAS